MKANGHPAVVRAALDAADGLEVASTGELQAATDELRAATDELQAAAGGLGTATGKLVLFSGPAKSDEGLRAAVAGERSSTWRACTSCAGCRPGRGSACGSTGSMRRCQGRIA
ncbi:hypothetical protein [Dactylosporangium darangshiense]|uniref:hypothetical protein n=1 Tax=Dactylosporangium darangshiense TaxID=579108 RepID=UPI00363028FF